MTDLLKSSLTRRSVLQTAAVGAIGINPAVCATSWSTVSWTLPMCSTA